MPITSLVIGLGGTGQWVTLFVKKELLETHDNFMPPGVRVIAFDTVSKTTYSIGGHGEDRKSGGRTIGQVRLAPGEYAHAVGDNTNIKNFVTETASGQHAHVGSWFQAAWYKQHLPDALFDLAEGAGMFRQFGRLAIFNDVRAPALSRIYNMLQDAIGALKRETNDSELQVFIVGSLAGGTGAGMFADIAHLVRQIAQQPNVAMKPTVRGYLVLPDAFSRTINDGSLLASMRARAYAAMRENRRFSASFDWERGYPMTYNTLNEGLWRAPVKGKLFDYLYYLDGQRPRNTLAQYKMEQGVAPTIADAITAILDGQAGAKFKEYTLNVTAEYAARVARGAIDPAASVVGSIGTFTIVFPIYHIIEGWSYRLAREVLEDLLAIPAATVDSKTGIPTALSRSGNAENTNSEGRDEAPRFLEGASPISNPFDPQESVELTLLAGEIKRIATQHKRDPRPIVDELTNRNLQGWNRSFEPTGGDPETLRLKEATGRVLQARLRAEVPASADKKPRGNPAEDLETIESGARTFKNTHLGVEDPGTGQRFGGQYSTALNKYAEYHAERFRVALDLQMRIILNGRTREASKARGGKLGYLIDFLDETGVLLDHARQAMTGIAKLRRDQGSVRKNAISASTSALHDMRAHSRDKLPVIGTPAPAAFDSQVRYLDAEQKSLDILQAEAMETAVQATIGLMHSYTASALASARSWAVTLALDTNRGLYAEVLRGIRQVEAERREDAQIPVRMVRPKAVPDADKTEETDAEYVADKAYEETRYKHYLRADGHNGRQDALAGFQWSIDHEMEDNLPKVQLKLAISTADEAGRGPEYDPANLDKLLAVCRPYFESARNTESVMAYLQAVYPNANNLAQIIYDGSGVLLAHSGNPLVANYLRVAYDPNDPGQNSYVLGMMQRLGQLSSTGASGSQAGATVSFGQQVDSEDRFKCSLVHTEELVTLDKVSGFSTAQPDYATYSGERSARAANRRILHVFPAEVNAVGYEDRLGELDQARRELADKVTAQLEFKDELRDFLLCMAYNFIEVHEYDEGGTTYSVWRLKLPTGNGRTEEWYLTRPATHSPMLMDAVATYNYVRKDVGHGTSYAKEINYEQVRNALAWKRQTDAEASVAAGTAGQHAPKGLRASIDLLADASKRDALLELARRDPLVSFQNWIKDEFLLDWSGAVREDPGLQPDIDLASVFWLMLSDDAEQLLDAAERRVRAVPPQQSSDEPIGRRKRAGWGNR